MKKKNIILAALATVVMGACNAPQGETIVIEGRLTNVPDSIVLELTEWDGNVGDRAWSLWVRSSWPSPAAWAARICAPPANPATHPSPCAAMAWSR